MCHLSSRHVHSSSQTSQACGLAIGIPLRVYTIPFSSNVYSINVHLLAFIVLCYPHAFASDPILRMSFICAPYIKEVWGDAEVDGKIVAARQGNQLVTAFHPELNDSLEIHKYFLGMCSK